MLIGLLTIDHLNLWFETKRASSTYEINFSTEEIEETSHCQWLSSNHTKKYSQDMLRFST